MRKFSRKAKNNIQGRIFALRNFPPSSFTQIFPSSHSHTPLVTQKISTHLLSARNLIQVEFDFFSQHKSIDYKNYLFIMIKN
jgi:hypothetical protein